MSSQRYRGWVLLFVILGVGLRLAYVVILLRDDLADGDAYFYHWQAIENVHGNWWINPYASLAMSNIPSAGHPPLFVVLLMIPSALGVQSYLGHLCFGAVFGGVTIGLTAGLARDLFGRRAAVIAAALAALYPLQVINDTRVMSESLTATTVVVVLWAGYRWWKAPSASRAVLFGVAIAAGALTRAELVLLGALVAVSLGLSVRSRIGFRAAGVGFASLVVAAAVTVAPWVAYNMNRFTEPVFISNGFGPTLASANCDHTYSGRSLGYWDPRCLEPEPAFVDESARDKYLRERYFVYIRDHVGELPKVASARVLRMFNLFRPVQQIELDLVIEEREWWLSACGFWAYWVLAPPAAAACIVLRRRGIPWFALFSPVIVVVFTAITAFGQTRYRVTSDAAMIPAAAVALAALWERIRPAVSERVGVDDPPTELGSPLVGAVDN